MIFDENMQIKPKCLNSNLKKIKKEFGKKEMIFLSDNESNDDTNNSKNKFISCIKNDNIQNVGIQNSFN